MRTQFRFFRFIRFKLYWLLYFSIIENQRQAFQLIQVPISDPIHVGNRKSFYMCSTNYIEYADDRMFWFV